LSHNFAWGEAPCVSMRQGVLNYWIRCYSISSGSLGRMPSPIQLR